MLFSSTNCWTKLGCRAHQTKRMRLDASATMPMLVLIETRPKSRKGESRDSFEPTVRILRLKRIGITSEIVARPCEARSSNVLRRRRRGAPITSSDGEKTNYPCSSWRGLSDWLKKADMC